MRVFAQSCCRQVTRGGLICRLRKSAQPPQPLETVTSRRDVALALLLGSVVWPGSAQAAKVSDEAYTKADAIKRVVKLFINRNFDKLEELTAPGAFVFVQGPAELPYSGRYEGQDCVRQFMNQFNKSLLILSVPEVYYYINEAGSVFVGFDFELQTVQNPDVIFISSFAMKFKVDDELRLTKVAIISDTLRAYQSILGPPSS